MATGGRAESRRPGPSRQRYTEGRYDHVCPSPVREGTPQLPLGAGRCASSRITCPGAAEGVTPGGARGAAPGRRSVQRPEGTRSPRWRVVIRDVRRKPGRPLAGPPAAQGGALSGAPPRGVVMMVTSGRELARRGAGRRGRGRLVPWRCPSSRCPGSPASTSALRRGTDPRSQAGRAPRSQPWKPGG